MATRRKGVVAAVNAAVNADHWTPGEPVQMSNGMNVTRWEHAETGETRLVPTGLHPDDQPLNDGLPMLSAEPEIEETATDRVSAMLAQAQGADRAEVNVYRIDKGQREYCRKFRPDEFEDGSFDLLRTLFGPGEYELRLYATDPVTRKFCVRNLTRIKIAESKDTTRAELPSGLSQVLSTIAQGQERMLTALVEMKQAPQKDPMEEMTRMLGMMSAMREAMGLNQSQGREKSSIGEIVSAIRELRGAAEELTPQTEKEPDSLISMLPKVFELVKSGQQAQQGPDIGIGGMMPQAAAEPVLSPVTIPQSMAYPPIQPAQPVEEESTVRLTTAFKLRAYLKALINMAVAKDPVPKAAQFVAEKLPDDLLDMMELPAWFEMLASVAPEVRNHREYITAVRDAALALLDDPDDSVAEAPKAA
jgi:hypothetical protein